MTERTFGSNFKWFVAKVVNRGDGNSGEKDKTESGRVQIRIYGKHDDEQNIPDSVLPWAIPMLPVTAGAGRNGVSGTPVGLLKDSQVVGFYADEDENIPIIMGVLIRSGKDSDQSQDAQGENVTPENNDAPKGSRTADTQGSDKNDVLPTNNSLVSDVASKDQLHSTIPTMGNIPYDGSSVLDVMFKADPNNRSGFIPGALNGMKSMTSTLSVATHLLSNFSAIAKGQFSINSLLSLSANAIKLKNYDPTGSVANIANLVAKTASITASVTQIARLKGITDPSKLQSIVSSAVSGVVVASLAESAFSGGNPMESILGGLGGANGLSGMLGRSTTMLGAISGNFGAAAAIAGTLKGSGRNIISGLISAPIPLPFGVKNLGSLSNLGNIAQAISAIPGAISAASLLNSPLSAFGTAFSLSRNIPTFSLFNSTISIPNSVSLLSIGSVISRNPSINIQIGSGLNPTLSRSVSYKSYSSEIINDVVITSPTYYSGGSLNNSSISVNIPEGLTSYSVNRTLNLNPGINYNVHTNVFKVNVNTNTKRL